MGRGWGRWIGAGALALGVAIAAIAVLRGWIGLYSVRDAQAILAPVIAQHRAVAFAIAFLLCVILFALCFPAAPLIGLTAGALFGFWPAILLVWPAQATGSTLAFLGTRRWLRGLVSRRFAKRIAALEANHTLGTAALLSIRLNPLIPYWPVNLALGATDVPLGRFTTVTAIGLFPAMLIYAGAGTRLAHLRSLGDIVSPGLIGWMLLASLLPVAIGRLLAWRSRSGRSTTAPPTDTIAGPAAATDRAG